MDRETRRGWSRSSAETTPARSRTTSSTSSSRASSIARTSSGAQPSSASARGRSGCSSGTRRDGAPRSARRSLARRSAAPSASDRVAYNSSLEPYGLREAGSLGLAGIPGEYLTYTNNKLQVRPWLATSWKPNNDAHGLDVPDPARRQVPQRQDPERGRRRRELQAVPATRRPRRSSRRSRRP